MRPQYETWIPLKTQRDRPPGLERARLYAVADDAEKAVLDQLSEKAGIIWVCRHRDASACWTNPEEAARCERCGKARPRRRHR
jgi:hypothetical protein